MNYIEEMNKTVREFLNHIDEMLENDSDIKVNSVAEIQEKLKSYIH